MKAIDTWRRRAAGALITLVAVAPPAMAQVGPNARRAASSSSDIRAVLAFEGDWSNQVPQLTSTSVVPTLCQTAPYVAGPNEVAVTAFDGEFAPSGTGSPNLVLLRTAVAQDGGAFSIPAALPARQEFGNLAHLSMARRIVLDEGSTYVFGAAFSVLFPPVTTALGDCRGTVTIVRLDP